MVVVISVYAVTYYLGVIGKMVYELRPAVDWHKGKAVEWLLEEIQQDYRDKDIIPVYIGDDVTDEDAFRALKPLGGIGVYVGDQPMASDTEATFYVEDPFQVKEFLHLFVTNQPLSSNVVDLDVMQDTNTNTKSLAH